MWVIVLTDEMNEKGLPWALYLGSDDENFPLPMPAVFTDEDLADRFLETRVGLETHRIETSQDLRILLAACQTLGIDHVGIDIPSRINPHATQGRCYTIAELLAAFPH